VVSLIAVLSGCAPEPPASSQPSSEAVPASQIDANVPAEADFSRFLIRDCDKYLRSQGYNGDVVSVELLRQGPTQVGTGYPKFYAWLTMTNRGKPVVEGAARLEAMDRKELHVTDFVRKADIKSGKAKLEDIFPATLLADIQTRAAK
jgi:hypothetical protein